MTGLPKDLISGTMNLRQRRIERSHTNDATIPKLHVSSLIKSGTQDAFCPREFVLRYIEPTEAAGAGIPPKFQLLYEVGHFYGDYLVREFLRRNPEWANYAWGDWSCGYGCTVIHRQCKHEVEGHRCEECGGEINHYRETDLINPRQTVVGHADLIFNVDGWFYVYEFKSIDRADVVFSEIKEPLGDHLLQASNYYYMLKSEGKRVSQQIRFVYIDRSMDDLYRALPFREVQGLRVRKRRLYRIYERAQACHTAIEKRVLPDRICDRINCSRAKQCSKAVSCFARQKNTFKLIP